ncbi:MAG: DUF748 domain-containing protein, partial [Prolixibacteraceae bacterium]|nr:DUF748 domain-containing protein [Prolixibacteraceae bacterium]
VNPFGQKNMGNQFSVFVPEMNFTDFNINDALTENNFSFDKIEIKNPEVNMNITDSVKGNKLEVAQNLDLFPYVEPYVNKINVNELLLYNASIQFNWFERVLINKRFNLNFKEIRIGKDSKAGNLLNSKEFEISTTHLRRESKNGLYAFTADSLVYNSVRHNLLLTKLKVTPLLGRDEFSRRTGVQTDHVIFSSDFANLQGIDENQWLKDNSLRAEKLVVGPSMLDIYRNKRYPFNHSQRPPWPQDLLKNIKQSFAFDSVLLLPSKVTYSELMDFSDEPGKITFSSLSLKAGQCSNIESNLKKQKNLKIETNALLYNQSPLSATINFDLTSKNYAHTVRGSLSGMPMKPLNAMLEKAAPVAIESGRINRFDFNIFFTDKNASGKLYFGYDNFKISILEFNSDATKRSRFASFWANKMVLNSKNPKGKTLLPVTLFYRRDKERSIINYWWKTILTGSKQTLGINREPKTKK